MSVETKTIKEICEEYGCTIEEWNKVVAELCAHGIRKGVYQDYQLLTLVIQRLVPGGK